jgi:YndJ-like protein
MKRWLPFSVAGAIWLFLAFARTFLDLGEALVGFAIAVVVPLGVALTAGSYPARVSAVQRRVVALGAAFGLASFLFAPGAAAATLALAWLLATVPGALLGLSRLSRRPFEQLQERAIDIAQLYLPVGAAWLFASRAGLAPLGFQEPIVLYTAAHFHFAGFAAPLIVGLLGRDLGLNPTSIHENPGSAKMSRPVAQWVATLYRGAALIVIVGVPLVAVGITVSRALEGPAAVLLGIGMLALASLLVARGGKRISAAPLGDSVGRPTLFQQRLSGALFVSAGLSLVGSMVFAILFALTSSANRNATTTFIPYSLMALCHGVANAIGFSTLSLVGFALAPRIEPPQNVGGPL